MKKVIILAMLFASATYQISFADTVVKNTQERNKTSEVEKAYQQGLEAAKEGIENQKKWAKGRGDPDMAKAYQEGLRAAKEIIG